MAIQKFMVVLFQDDDQGETYYRVMVPDYPGCITDGATVEEALANAKDALEGILEADAQRDMDPPPPNTRYPQVVVAEVDIKVPEELVKKQSEMYAAEVRPAELCTKTFS